MTPGLALPLSESATWRARGSLRKPVARGSAGAQRRAGGDSSLVSDAILEKLGLARDADGRLVPAGGDSTAVGRS